MISVIERPHQLIHIEASLDQYYGTAYFKCKQLERANSHNNIVVPLSTLPRSLCPKVAAFDDLIMLASEIQTPYLKSFLDEVLLQSQVAIRYLNAPASLNHHHNYPGGLIEHSVDTAWRLINEPEISKSDRDIAIVAGLLHDIGKTQTMTSDLRRTATGKLVDHDQLTLEICATAMSKLEKKASVFANQLRHAWTCYSPNARFGFKPKTHIARLLQKSDRESAQGKKRSIPLPKTNDVFVAIRLS
ncbi:HDIG domain-containing protein [Alteromonas sp. ASW11-36]|uniref:HDIG domain-containing protein n=2 Tax=Alteromonas arenosi TaxID=3055817 RepID=A0ABT7T0F0_9ALTE|nr:HDIG domain-containing protein [Alteromonas sp. ASW11-36]